MINKEIDPGVLPLVKYFNEQGLTTNMSCQGHIDKGYPYMTMFWISFTSEITEEDIGNFMKRHLDKKFNNFYSCGRFAKRFYIYNFTQESYHWCYFAANIDAAMEDLRHWQMNDNGEEYKRNENR